MALVDRNLSARIYDEEKISKITQRIEEQYFELFLDLKQMFENIRLQHLQNELLALQ